MMSFKGYNAVVLAAAIAKSGRGYIDGYGTVRRLVPAPDCDCCLEGVLEGRDAETGECWVMAYSLPREAVTCEAIAANEVPF